IHLPRTGFRSILRSPVAQLRGAQIFSVLPDPCLDVLGGQADFFPLRHASEQNVSVGMFSVEMGDGYPFQWKPQIGRYPVHKLTGQLLEVQSLTEFGRENQLEHSAIPGDLPVRRRLNDIDLIGLCVETVARFTIRAGGTLPNDIATMRRPLARRPVGGVTYSH